MDKNFFIEQLIKRETTPKDMALKVAIIIGGVVLSGAVALLVPALSFIIIAGVIFGAWYLLQRTNKEYEYIFTNGELDIDTIFSKTKRAKSFNSEVRQFQIVAKVDDANYAGELSKYDQVLDYSSGTNEKSTYAAILTHKGKRTKMLFEPNEKILEAMKYYIPQKLKYKKYGY